MFGSNPDGALLAVVNAVVAGLVATLAPTPGNDARMAIFLEPDASRVISVPYICEMFSYIVDDLVMG